MVRQKSELVSALGRTLEALKPLSQEVQDLGGGDDDIVRAFQKDTVTRRKIAELIVGIRAQNVYSITVNYDQPLAEMIEAGRYDYVNPDITAQHFPIKQTGTAELEIQLVHFNKYMSSGDVLSELDTRGLRAATLPEGLALTAPTAYPGLQRQFPIVLLGSVWRYFYARCIPYASGERGLRLSWFGKEWGSSSRFAAVSK